MIPQGHSSTQSPNRKEDTSTLRLLYQTQQSLLLLFYYIVLFLYFVLQSVFFCFPIHYKVLCIFPYRIKCNWDPFLRHWTYLEWSHIYISYRWPWYFSYPVREPLCILLHFRSTSPNDSNIVTYLNDTEFLLC